MATENEAQHALREALREFSNSARYGFLKNLHVGPVLGEDSETLGEISQLTFAELVVLATEAPEELHHLTSAQERVLTTLLCALSEGGSVPKESASQEDVEEVSDADEQPRASTLNSVQCELDLRERLAQLRIHPQFSRVKDIQLRHFWDRSAPASPFEESFTIQQLMGMDLSVLSKKRSMTGARLVGMTRALDNALRSLEGELVAPEVPRPRRERTEPQHSMNNHPWSSALEGLSPVDAAVVDAFMRGAGDSFAERTISDDALGRLAHFISASDFVAIVNGEALTASCSKKLSMWLGELSDQLGIVVLRSVLSSPGVHVTRLRDFVAGGAGSQVFYALGAIVCARAMGAREVCVGSKVCRGVWSLNPSLASLALREVRSAKRQSAAKAIRAVCPDLDPFLHTWMCGLVKEVVRPVRVSKKGRKGRR